MRALPFAILAAIALVLQISVVPAIAVSGGFEPQLLLILALFVALFARAEAALIGCWVLGLLVDLQSEARLGSYAFAFGLVGLGIVQIRSSLFRDHPLSHVVLAFLFCLLAEMVAAAPLAVSGVPPGALIRLLLYQPLSTAAYTSLLTPCLMPLLNTFRRKMQFPERV